MKYRWDKKYLYWGITAFLVIAASIVFYYFLFHSTNIKDVFQRVVKIAMPVINGMILAYLLTPIVNVIERKMLIPLCHKFNITITHKKKRVMRGFSVGITMLLFLFAIYGFFMMVVPQIVNSLQTIALQFPMYISNLEKWLRNLLADNPSIEAYATDLFDRYSDDITQWLNTSIIPQLNILIRQVSVSVVGLLSTLVDFLIGFIISIYLLGSKELFAGQVKKIIYAVASPKNGNAFIRDFRFVNRTFGGFISGKLLDSLIMGFLCFIGMTIFQLPFAVLISVIVGVTNVIPFFGPYIGAIPSAILILMVDPLKALYFCIFILVLQQFDGNVLGPKILGDSTGLSSFWVISAITVFGGFFGVLGMAVGVPIFAVLYAGFRRICNRLLKRKGLSVNTADYLQLSKIEGAEFIELEPPQKKKRKEHERADDNDNKESKESKEKTDEEDEVDED